MSEKTATVKQEISVRALGFSCRLPELFYFYLMPEHQQSHPAPPFSAEDLIAIAYGTFQQLNWTLKFAGEVGLVGYTPKSWKRYAMEILVTAEEAAITVRSKMIHNESWDPRKVNEKNVSQFITAFEQVKASVTPQQLARWRGSVEQMRRDTAVAVEQEAKESEEVEKIMRLNDGSRTLTIAIIAINVLVFLAMAVTGAGIFSPSTESLLQWGGNFRPYTTDGDWWRLITSTFVHAGIIHIAFNMYALYMAGFYLEPMLGKLRYATAYLCTGVLASIASIALHDQPIVSVGASGAIFGLYGVFLALLTTRLIPNKMRKGLLQSIGIFVFYNLAYGASASSVDNYAHLGGLVSGLVIGYLYFFTLRQSTVRNANIVSVALLLLTAFVTNAYLIAGKTDGRAYRQHVQQFATLEDKAMKAMRDTSSVTAQLTGYRDVARQSWLSAQQVMKQTDTYKLDAADDRQRGLLEKYIDLRIRETDLSIQYLQGDTSANTALSAVEIQLKNNLEELKK
jgi:rhomboid protease GluP